MDLLARLTAAILAFEAEAFKAESHISSFQHVPNCRFVRFPKSAVNLARNNPDSDPTSV